MTRQRGNRLEGLNPAIKTHILRLGFADRWAYFRWCSRNGFKQVLKKSLPDREAEIEVREREQRRRDEQARIHHNPEVFIREACHKRIQPEQLSRRGWRSIAQTLAFDDASPEFQSGLTEFLTWLHRKSDFLLEQDSGWTPYLRAATRLYLYRQNWIRKPKTWSPRSYNARKQFASLAQHLFVRYPVPTFMEAAWFDTCDGGALKRRWYIHLASGRNMRTAPELPMPLTKMTAHYFLQAPSGCRILEAFRWAQVRALGGDERLALAVAKTWLGESYENSAFWDSVIRYFIEHPALPLTQIPATIDFLQAQKYKVRECLTGPGMVETIQPPQPKLRMHGRSLQTLLRQIERWQKEEKKLAGVHDLYFKKSGINGFLWSPTKRQDEYWTIRELLSGADLIREGRALNHCVGTYARYCTAGWCSLWSLERHQKGKVEKCQTLEVDDEREIVQCAGHNNRDPSSEEMKVVRKWAESARLKISPNVLAA
ncbi:MAG: PcfJ domain-containing protein [Alphaproteobacteria bacterium]|nr:PcfJ domain-containing protein [Alphaproteobacteria bacterium]